MRKKYLLFVLALFSYALQSAVIQSTSRYGVGNGLSDAEVTSLCLDKRGFLWIGTSDGLNCFDGYEFLNFISNPIDSSSLFSDYIIKIEEDNQGNIWCASNNGVSRYNLLKNNFTYFPLNTTTAISSEQLNIEDMVFNKNKDILYLLGSNFLTAIDLKQGKQTSLLSPEFLETNHYNEFLSCINLKSSDVILLRTLQDIYLYSPSGKSINKLRNPGPDVIKKDGGILGITGSTMDDFFVYTSHHVIHTNVNNEIIKIIDINQELGNSKVSIVALQSKDNTGLNIILSSGICDLKFNPDRVLNFREINLSTDEKVKVNSFLEDHSGLLWFGTSNGLIKVNPFQNVFTTIDLNSLMNSPEIDYVSSECFDNGDLIWVGLHSGKLFSLDPLKTTQKELVLSETNVESVINDVLCLDSGNIFVSTARGLLIFNNKTGKNYKPEIRKAKVILPGNKVYFTTPFDKDTLWVASEKGIFSLCKRNFNLNRISELSEKINNKGITDFKANSEYIWIAMAHEIFEFDKKKKITSTVSFPAANFNGLPFINSIFPLRDKELLIGTDNGLYIYYTDIKIINAYAPNNITANNYVHAVNKDYLGQIWVSTSKGIISHNPVDYQTLHFDSEDGLITLNYSNRLTSASQDGKIIFGSLKSITLLNPDSVTFDKNIPVVQFLQATISGKGDFIVRNISNHDTLILEARNRYLKVSFSSLDFWAPKKNRYKYSLEELGEPDKWISLDNQNYLIVTGLTPGYYKLTIQGSNSQDVWNKNKPEIIIRVKATFMQSHWATVLFISFALLIFYFTFLYATKQLRKLNKEYRERELIAKKVEQQKEELTMKNKNITDSINYAKRIQEALMPSQKIFKKHFPESFILHIPKDIVSGDFYWINEVDGRIYFAAVDCTGHGVPGAFMSIIGFELFRRITETEKKKQPAEILKSLSRGFETFFRDVENYTLRDGMDVAFCAIDTKLMHLEFAGAFNPLYLVRDNSITEIKGDRFSVGLFNFEEAKCNKFKSYVIPLYEGDIIYIFTDGFADQFGGPEGKKYKYRRFRHLLLALHQLPMDQQIDFLRRSVNDWKGELDQVDDILIMGIRITQNGNLINTIMPE